MKTATDTTKFSVNGMLPCKRAKLHHSVVVRGYCNSANDEVPGENKTATVFLNPDTGMVFVMFLSHDGKEKMLAFPASSVKFAEIDVA